MDKKHKWLKDKILSTALKYYSKISVTTTTTNKATTSTTTTTTNNNNNNNNNNDNRNWDTRGEEEDSRSSKSHLF